MLNLWRVRCELAFSFDCGLGWDIPKMSAALENNPLEAEVPARRGSSGLCPSPAAGGAKKDLHPRGLEFRVLGFRVYGFRV